jgi:hypothetical protein
MEGFESIGGERREDRRYEIELDVRWKVVRRKRVIESGNGRTIDLSSGGIRFESGQQLAAGLSVELSIAWPFLLHNVAPLQLIVKGRIVRSGSGWAAIRTVQHEFRTMGVPADHRDLLAHVAHTPGLLAMSNVPGMNRVH